jgi:hypothetical protein
LLVIACAYFGNMTVSLSTRMPQQSCYCVTVVAVIVLGRLNWPTGLAHFLGLGIGAQNLLRMGIVGHKARSKSRVKNLAQIWRF